MCALRLGTDVLNKFYSSVTKLGAVAQLVKWSFSIPEVCGSIPIIGKFIVFAILPTGP